MQLHNRGDARLYLPGATHGLSKAGGRFRRPAACGGLGQALWDCVRSYGAWRPGKGAQSASCGVLVPALRAETLIPPVAGRLEAGTPDLAVTHAGRPGGWPPLELAQCPSAGVGWPANRQNNGHGRCRKVDKRMTIRAADRDAERGTGSVRERRMPASARGGGSVGESTRGVLPSRPPAAPAWTGYGEGGGRALDRLGLLRRLRFYRRRCSVLDWAICMQGLAIRARRGRV